MAAMRARSLVHVILLSAIAIGWGVSPSAAQRGPYGAPSQRGADRAGVFDYYTLVLAWSPTYCAGLRSKDYEPQCHGDGRSDGRPYTFVLHGLWPQYERGYPEYCRTAERPFVPRPVINGMLDIMPSPRLVIHEYRKHGTCSGLDPAAYFDAARRLYEKVKIPQRFLNPRAPFFVAPGELVQELVAANPGLTPGMIGIECRGSGQRLREVRICFSREGEFRECGANEDPRRLCRADRMYVPPVRRSADQRSNQRGQQGQRYPSPDERSLLGALR
jgi:ribonuclease T2